MATACFLLSASAHRRSLCCAIHLVSICGSAGIYVSTHLILSAARPRLALILTPLATTKPSVDTFCLTPISVRIHQSRLQLGAISLTKSTMNETDRTKVRSHTEQSLQFPYIQLAVHSSNGTYSRSRVRWCGGSVSSRYLLCQTKYLIILLGGVGVTDFAVDSQQR